MQHENCLATVQGSDVLVLPFRFLADSAASGSDSETGIQVRPPGPCGNSIRTT